MTMLSRKLVSQAVLLCVAVVTGHESEFLGDMIWNDAGEVDDSELMGVQLLQTDLVMSRLLGHAADMQAVSDQQARQKTQRPIAQSGDLSKQLEEAKYGYDQAKTHVQELEDEIVKMTEIESVADSVSTVSALSHAAAQPDPSFIPSASTDATPNSPSAVANMDDDIYAFLSVLAVSSAMGVVCVVLFVYARGSYPLIYSNNIVTGTAPGQENRSWLSSSWSATYEDSGTASATQDGSWLSASLVGRVGLDNALVLKFCDLCIRILFIIGVPILFIEGPMNYFFGGGAAGRDYLSYLSFGNVENGSWLYWVHAGFVWFVVLAVERCVYGAQAEFLKLRVQWLKDLPEYRANTLLVEGIPAELRSDARLKEYFDKMLDAGAVVSAHMVKDTSSVLSASDHVKRADDALKEVEELAGADPEGSKMSSEILKALKAELQPKRDAVTREKNKDMVGTCCGFVSFKTRRDADVALSLVYRPDVLEMVCSSPPEPQDIIWSDLTMSPDGQTLRAAIGYVLVAVIYFFYTPLVVAVTNVARAINVGPFQPLWQGIGPSLGLHIAVGCFPTLLLPLLRSFFILRADAWAQSKLQMWYFCCLMVFLIFVTCVGDGVVEILTVAVTDPFAIVGVLGHTMPQATHFYMNFIVLQWGAVSFGLLRLGQWWTFTATLKLRTKEDEARRVAEPEARAQESVGSRSDTKAGKKADTAGRQAEPDDQTIDGRRKKIGAKAEKKEEEDRRAEDLRLKQAEEDARQDARRAAEPEDQGYNGVGSRSARLAAMMVVGIVFSTLSPGIALLTLIHFVLCRLVYGYLIPFAETRKADLGGVFWVGQLQHLFFGSVIYCVLMTVVLYGRAGTGDVRNIGPACVAAPSILYTLRSASTFKGKFNWEKLPFKDVIEVSKQGKNSKNSKRQTLRQYVQPELFH